MKPTPVAPPPLLRMAARKDALELDRVVMFEFWKLALECAEGNVTLAAESSKPPMTRHKGNRLTRRFGLVEYAASLRRAATGRAFGPGKSRRQKNK